MQRRRGGRFSAAFGATLAIFLSAFGAARSGANDAGGTDLGTSPSAAAFELARRILDESAVAFNKKSHLVIYATDYEQEGTGVGLDLRVRKAYTIDRSDPVEVYVPGDEDLEAKIQAAIPKLTARLASGDYVGVPGKKFPKGENTIRIGDVEVGWRSPRITVSWEGKHWTSVVKILKRYELQPEWVYSAPKQGFVAVAFRHHPGENFESRNIYTSLEMIRVTDSK